MRAPFFAFCILLLCPCLFAGGSAETDKKTEDYPAYTAVISGTLRLVGNEPFTRLVVSSGDGRDYIIDEAAPERKALHSHQGRRVQMEALIREYPVYAGKKYLGLEYFITPVHYDFMPSGEAQ
jgi:hypothetical protein